MNAAASRVPPTARPLSPEDKAFRRDCAIAVLAGIYASYGHEIMEADQAAYAKAIRTARRVAFEQADEMVRGEPS